MEYIAYLHKDKNSDFGVSFPDFPGCITAGKTLEEARELAGRGLDAAYGGNDRGRGGVYRNPRRSISLCMIRR